MSQHLATVEWSRGDQAFTDRRYRRAHRWRFDGGAVIEASPSPQIVPVPMSDPAGVDPEEAFVASLASCHMLFFLDLASRAGWVVDDYTDEAAGVLAKNGDGALAMTEVVLRPRARFGGERRPDAAEIERLHHESHARCFLANSVRTEVRCEPRGD